jgi:sugar lactone lactonase YvrE
MRALRRIEFLGLVSAVLLLTLLAGDPTTSPARTPTGAPFQIVATGLEEPTGLVFHPGGDGFLVLSDRKTGVLYRFTPGVTATGAPAFTSEVLFSGLDEPIAVVVDRDGHLLVAESDKGRVVRFGKLGEEVFSAVPEPIADGLKEPRWLAVEPEGRIVLSAEGVKREALATGTPQPTGDVLLRTTPEGRLSVVADRFEGLSGLAIGPSGELFAGARERRGKQGTSAGAIFKSRLPAGPVSRVVAGGVERPQDLEFDGLGALFVTATEFHGRADRDDHDRLGSRASGRQKADGRDEDDDEEDDDEDEPGRLAQGVILKATFKADGTLDRLTRVASGLGQPMGLAFDAEGHLYVAEAQHGRVLRFQAPAAPVLDPSLARYTNDLTPLVRGTAEPNALITVLGAASPAIGLATEAGAFAVEVVLTPNTEHTLRVYATAGRGERLTSAPTVATVTHDDQPPDTEILGGPSGELSSTTATFTFTATEAGSTFLCQLDGGGFAACTSPKSYPGLTPGLHTFRVKAQDQAGNEDPSPAERTFTVSALRIRIISPAAGSTVTAGNLLVRGTVEAAGAEVAVSVNGVPAAVQGIGFAALVSVAPDTPTLIAVATTASGTTVSHSIPISVSAAIEPAITLHASPPSGVAPLTVHFSVVNGLLATAIELDADGNGSADFTGSRLDEQPFTFTQPGLYVATARVTETPGPPRSVQAIIQVLDPSALDALLQSKWIAMKQALRVGQIGRAVANITERTRADYESAFTVIAARLPEIDMILTDITLVEVRHAAAIYEATRVDGSLVKSFEVRFAIDFDGIWRIEAF